MNETGNHLETRVPLTIEQMSFLWADQSDRVRLEMIKSIIWTAPDMRGFHEKAVKAISSNKFKASLD